MSRRKPIRGRGPLVEVEWVAGMAGVTLTAFAKWRKANGFKSIKGEGGKHYVSWEAAQRYLEDGGTPRVSEPPAGWKTVKTIAAETGIPERMLRRGATRRVAPAVRVRSNLYVEPRALIEWAKARLPEPLPHGWYTAGQLGEKVGVEAASIRAFVHRHGLEHRHMRIGKQPAPQMAVPPKVARMILRTLSTPVIAEDEAPVLEWGQRFGPLAERFYYFVVDRGQFKTFKRRSPKNARVVRAAKIKDLKEAEEVFCEWAKSHLRRGKERLQHACGGGREADGEAHPAGDRARLPHDSGPVSPEDQGGPRDPQSGHRPPGERDRQERRVSVA